MSHRRYIDIVDLIKTSLICYVVSTDHYRLSKDCHKMIYKMHLQIQDNPSNLFINAWGFDVISL